MKLRSFVSGLALGVAALLVGCDDVDGPSTSSLATVASDEAIGDETAVPKGATASGADETADANPEEKTVNENAEKVVRTDAEWKSMLTPEQYYILRQKGTESPFVNEYDHHFEPGTYVCAACGAELFESDTKFNSGCGWPAFYAAKAGDRVTLTRDYSHGMVRTEVTCSRCDGHLGHIFDDAPQTPTGQRYCINSVSIKFVPKADGKEAPKSEDAAESK